MNKFALKQLWHQYNQSVFNGGLILENLNWSKNKTTWGFYVDDKGIQIYKHMPKNGMYKRALAHEMCHQAQNQIDRIEYEANNWHGETFHKWASLFDKKHDNMQNLIHVEV